MSDYRDKIPDYCKRVLALLNSAGHEAYVVGGAVRDLVMGITPHDLDVTTSATPDEIISVMDSAGLRHIPTGIKHGTVTVLAGVDGRQEQVEITTFRVDGSYTDARHPDNVEFTRSIEEDVRRRDFTINAMYLDREGNIIDLTGGLADAEDHIIRAVGDADKRFGEDALRIMRGLRLSAVTGFVIADDTMEAMISDAHLLGSIAGERIASELNRLVTAPYAASVIHESVPVLKVLIPEIEECQGFDQRSPFHDKDVLGHTLSVLEFIPLGEDGRRDLALSLAALFHDIAKPAFFYTDAAGTGHMKGHPAGSAVVADRIMTDLHYPRSLRDEVVKLVAYHDYYVKPSKPSVHRLISNCTPDFFRKLVVLQRADILAHSGRGQDRLSRLDAIVGIADELDREGAVYRVQDLDISGKDIIGLGVAPGAGVGKILDKLFDEYIAGTLANDRDLLMRRAAELV